MKINHASILRKEYFVSYFNLILKTRTSDLEEERAILFDNFFDNNKDQLGPNTF